MRTGTWIRTLRERAGITQAELAIRAGTTQAAISRLETGTMSPTVDRLEQLLLCMGMRLTFGAEPLDAWTDEQHLAEFAELTPAERIAYGMQSSRGLVNVVGSARRA